MRSISTATALAVRHQYFRKSVSPVVTTTMSYYAGRKQRLELQVYYDGQWYSSTEYFALSKSGVSRVSLGAPGKAGIRARVRASYIDPTSGDRADYTTHSCWKYLYFTN
ncbi:hypothetical protein [Streptomyces sp. CB03238]|uniref:hypothetical protein n=1 Tax=Streptomyces sp. CB03238 TaxID=1907777 RepID=UPI000A0FA57B|nr:hypothetical protein [Streptomyces sp. CB03238]ORT58696.1 hypothetical protein BKD26_16035 [Streptomyces sp. CB03238]